MPRITLNLLDEHERLIDSFEAESDDTYTLNSHFRSPDGGVDVVCEVKPTGPARPR